MVNLTPSGSISSYAPGATFSFTPLFSPSSSPLRASLLSSSSRRSHSTVQSHLAWHLKTSGRSISNKGLIKGPSLKRKMWHQFITSVFEQQLAQVNENDTYIKELFNTEKYKLICFYRRYLTYNSEEISWKSQDFTFARGIKKKLNSKWCCQNCELIALEIHAATFRPKPTVRMNAVK